MFRWCVPVVYEPVQGLRELPFVVGGGEELVELGERWVVGVDGRDHAQARAEEGLPVVQVDRLRPGLLGHVVVWSLAHHDREPDQVALVVLGQLPVLVERQHGVADG